MKFKIDLCSSHYAPFGLYIAQKTFFGTKWKSLEHFETREKAKEYYEKIKDLPEYLN